MKGAVKIIVIILLILNLGCQNTSDILPNIKMKYIEKYHCWPYNVKVYSYNNINIDSLFYTYPLKSYYGDNPKYKTITWTKYLKVDTNVWYGMDKAIKQCDDNIELYNQILKGGDVYYTGRYQYFKNRKGEKRREYEEILFLNLNNKKLYIFKDINKVY